MTCRDDDASTSFLAYYSEFGRRGRGFADIYYIKTHRHQRAYNKILDHLSGNTRITTYNYRVAVSII